MGKFFEDPRQNEPKTPVVNGSFTDKMCVKETPICSSSTANLNLVPKINGHSNELSANMANGSGLANGSSDTNIHVEAAEKFLALTTQIIDENRNNSNTPSKSDSLEVLVNGSSCNGEEDGFQEVVNRKQKKRNKQQKRSFRSPAVNIKNGVRDKKTDKSCDDKTSKHSAIPPTNQTPAAFRNGALSYSSVLKNGHSQNSEIKKGDLNTSNIKNVSKNSLESSKLPETGNSAEEQSRKSDVDSDERKSDASDTSVSLQIVNSPTKVIAVQTDPETSLVPTSKEMSSKPESAASPNSNVDVVVNNKLPSAAAYCDSVLSDDSGRGESEITYDSSMPYCCEFPREKTSQLIGRGGSFKYEIESRSGIKLWVYPNDSDSSQSIVTMTGTGAQIERAKQLIRERFRNVPLTDWHGPNPVNIMLSDRLSPRLPESTDFMGVVSCLYNPYLFWIQPFGHPYSYAVEDLERQISRHFQEDVNAPVVDNPQEGSVVCVPGARDAYNNIRWIRGQVMSVMREEGSVVVRYLDHGGDHLVPINNLRPVRQEFFKIPFFAAICFLDDCVPTGAEWSEEACAEFTRLCNGSSNPPIIRVVGKSTDSYCVTVQGWDPDIVRPDGERGAKVDVATQLILKGLATRPILPPTEFEC